MPKPSILAKFKPPVYFFEFKPAWLYHSYETPEAEKLEMILEEKDDKVGINFYKKYGVHPSEREQIKEIVDKLEASEKAYVNHLDLVAQKTGIRKTDIVALLETDNNATSVIEGILEETLEDSTEKTVEALKQIKETLDEVKKQTKQENRENAQILEVYLGELNEFKKAWTEMKNEYYLHLETVFLNTARCAANQDGNSPGFTVENIKNMHPGFQTSLFVDFIWEELNAWPDENKNKNGKSDKKESGASEENKDGMLAEEKN